MRNINKEEIIKFIKETVHNAGKNKVVLGVSGGVDSALVLKLAIEALGKENVIAVLLPYLEPYRNFDKSESYNHAIIQLDNHPKNNIIIKSIYDIVNRFNEDDDLQNGNIMARVRMIMLYNIAAKNNALVIGTTNYSEYCTGYFTKWGDGAVDFEPIMHLYKTQVYQLAKEMGVPDRILQRKPTADLWANQTDEGEMGITYEELDMLLDGGSFDTGLEDPYYVGDECADYFIELGEKYEIVRKLIYNSSHKRKNPPSKGMDFQLWKDRKDLRGNNETF